SGENVTEIPWPAGAVPDGAYTTKDELFKEGRRAVLAPLQRNAFALRSREPARSDRRNRNRPKPPATCQTSCPPQINVTEIRIANPGDTACATSCRIKTWRRLPGTRRTINRSHSSLANLPSFSSRAFGCAGRRRTRRGAQRKHRELAAERCVILQGGITTDGAQTFGGFSQASSKTNAGPAADAGQDRNVLLATMLIGGHVSDDAGRRLELVEFLACLGVDGLEIAFERAVEHHAAGGRQGTRPDRKQLFVRPDDLAGLAVPRNEVAHVRFAGRRVH